MKPADNIHRWADGAVIYQIYPRSFQDSNGDGIGDLQGIIQRLGYLQDLGVTAIWLSPFYPSPMADFGYDVADYCDVDPIFGSLADFKQLLRAANNHGIKVLVDIVPNHSSDEHPWFRQSRLSKSNPKADWYIWKDPINKSKTGKRLLPNNWIDVFAGESAWEWEPKRKQYYLHSFHKGQPDLNWENPEVRHAIKQVLRFWLNLGVDGFRVDAVPFIGKDPSFRNDPVNKGFNKSTDHPYGKLIHKYSCHWPSHFKYLNMLSEVLKEERFSNKPRFMITESYTPRIDPVQEYLNYYTSMDPYVAAPFIFEGIHLPWNADIWREFLSNFHSALEELSPLALSSYAFGNHDQWRLVTRLGLEKARAAAVMKLTLPGVIFVYYGEDIGMHNFNIPPEQVQDPGAKGDKDSQGRDPERTPMQWSSEYNAGFSKAKSTWLPLADDYKDNNVEAQDSSKASFLNLYKSLIKLRRTSRAIKRGLMSVEETTNTDLLVYSRILDDETYTTVVNFSGKKVTHKFIYPGQVIISSVSTSHPNEILSAYELNPHEAIVIKST